MPYRFTHQYIPFNHISFEFYCLCCFFSNRNIDYYYYH